MIRIVAAHLADLVTFALAVGPLGIPIAQERNPTMIAAYLAAGVVGVLAWKTLLAGTLLLLVGRVRSRPRGLAIAIAAGIGLVGVAGNVTTIFVR